MMDPFLGLNEELRTRLYKEWWCQIPPKEIGLVAFYSSEFH